MNLSVKCVLNLSAIAEDPEVEKDLRAQEKPLKVAAVRNREVLAAVEVGLRKGTDLAQLPVALSFPYPGEEVPGVQLVVGRNLPDAGFLGAEPLKVWVGPERFSNGVADLGKEALVLPGHLFRRWLLLCRRYTISGRVVKRVWRWDPIEQMYVHCDEPVPGARVEALDVDCWWFWWKRDLAGAAVTKPDGTFEISFIWCCLLRTPWVRPRWAIDPELLGHIAEAVKPHVGPIPPEALESPAVFEKFLAVAAEMPGVAFSREVSAEAGDRKFRLCGKRAASPSYSPVLDRPAHAESPSAAAVPAVRELIDKIRRRLPFLPCWSSAARDCAPDIVFRVTQECGGTVSVIHDEGPFQTRWNIPTTLNVTLLASEQACSVPVCEELPVGDCLKLMWVNCIAVQHIGTSAAPVDQRGYAYPGTGDNPFAGTVTVKGLFGAGSPVDYFKVEYAFGGGAFADLPEDHLGAFVRSYWAPSPAAPPGSPATWNNVLFKPETVDGRVVYKTLRKAQAENPLPPGWLWGYLWNDVHTLFPWNSSGLDGDGLYTLRLVGYRWDGATGKLVDGHVLKTCQYQPAQDEKVLVRVDNRLDSDPAYSGSPCGPGKVHLCTYEPDCGFRELNLVRAGQPKKKIGPCDIVELADEDSLEIRFSAAVPGNERDGHLSGYSLLAYWGENDVFNMLAAGSLAGDPDPLVGPAYSQTFVGAQGLHRNALPATNLEHQRPFWFGGDFKVTVPGAAFATCAYTLSLRVWKRTIQHCTDPYYVHANWCSYSFTIRKI